MPVYPYVCESGHCFDQQRSVVFRDLPAVCADPCRQIALRDVGAQLRSITINSVPMNFFTQWYDVYDVSPKEMAKRADIQRYDPSTPHKPEIPRTKFNLPRGIEDVDTLVKAIAPVDGQHETDKMLRRTAPLEGEAAYG